MEEAEAAAAAMALGLQHPSPSSSVHAHPSSTSARSRRAGGTRRASVHRKGPGWGGTRCWAVASVVGGEEQGRGEWAGDWPRVTSRWRALC